MKWCEIFRTGAHTDSNGNSRLWTDSDLQEIKLNFEGKNPDVPICCGHPKSNSPAYGWVDKMKIESGKLYASFKDVLPEFKEAVSKGLFKTRSISLTSDLIPRHIAFLGAQPPAIKGMEQFCFNESSENDITINFNDINTNESDLKKLNQSNQPNNKGEIMDEETKKVIEAKDEEIATLRKQIEDDKQNALKKEFEEFCDEAISGGHILPSQKNTVINILTACTESTLNFADTNGQETSANNLFKNFITELKQMDFEEIANSKKIKNEPKTVDFSDAKNVALSIQAIQKEYAEKGVELNPVQALDRLKD